MLNYKIKLQPPLRSDFSIYTKAGEHVPPTLKIYEDENVKIVDGVCLKIVHKGSQLRIAQPYMSENIKIAKSFLASVDGVCELNTPNIYYGLFIDIWHGQYPNGWNNLCHWCDTFFNIMSAARLNVFESLTHIFLWQIKRSQWKEYGFHNTILNSVLEASNIKNVTLVFDEDIKNGSFWFFQRIAASKFVPRKLSQYSTHFTGCARGLKHVSDRLFYRSLLMNRYHLKEKNTKSLLYLKRHRVLIEDEKHLMRYIESKGYKWKKYIFTENVPFRDQFKQVSTSKIMLGSHGANMVHIIFMPKFSAVIEILNCKYHSFMYNNLAINSKILHSRVYASDACSNVSNIINTRSHMNNRIKIPTQRFYSAIDFSTR